MWLCKAETRTGHYITLYTYIMKKCTFIQIFYHYYLYSFFSIHIQLKMQTNWRHSDMLICWVIFEQKNTYFILKIDLYLIHLCKCRSRCQSDTGCGLSIKNWVQGNMIKHFFMKYTYPSLSNYYVLNFNCFVLNKLYRYPCILKHVKSVSSGSILIVFLFFKYWQKYSLLRV